MGATVLQSVRVANSGATSQTTPSMTTAASGSTFAIQFNGDASLTPTVSDNKGNTYTLVKFLNTGTASEDSGLWWYVCENGIGGSGHTATVAWKDSGGSAAAQYTPVFFAEIADDAGKIVRVDTGSIGTSIGTSKPFTATSGVFDASTTLALLAFCNGGSGNPYAYTEGTGFTQYGIEDDNNSFWGGAVWYKAISSTSAVTPSVTPNFTANPGLLAVFGLKSVSSGGITGAGQISSAEALGLPTVSTGIASAGVASAQALGAPVVGASVAPAGIASAQVFGAPVISVGIAPAAIASAAAVGALELGGGLAAAGIASSAAVGAPALGGGVEASGIVSAQAIGTPSAAAGIAAAQIASAGSSGSPAIGANVVADGVASVESLGAPLLSAALVAAGIPSAEAFGAPVIAPQGIVAAGIATAEAFGSLDLSARVAASSVSSAEGFGAAMLRAAIAVAGIPSEQTLGFLDLAAGIVVAGIASGERFGLPTVESDLPAAGIDCIGVPSAEAFGLPRIGYQFVRDERTYRVPAQSRVLRVRGSDRVYHVPPQNRTYKVRL